MIPAGLAFLVTVLAFSCAALSGNGDSARTVVRMETDFGPIVIAVEESAAPVTSANFLRYVDEDLWTGAHFYRVVTSDNQPNNSVRIAVIQGGLGWEESDAGLPPIRHETTKETGVSHVSGAISMARNEPGTASSEFFICLGPQPALDFGGARNPDGRGFAAFGRVIEGMDVVRRIHALPETDQLLDKRVAIRSIRRGR
ncbi:MAG: peptidylprolyl isomerase [Gemmatimonadetes bacterium]|nr:peptidylprolyl isomerase [Gemmatimonadota bacterium]